MDHTADYSTQIEVHTIIIKEINENIKLLKEIKSDLQAEKNTLAKNESKMKTDLETRISNLKNEKTSLEARIPKMKEDIEKCKGEEAQAR